MFIIFFKRVNKKKKKKIIIYNFFFFFRSPWNERGVATGEAGGASPLGQEIDPLTVWHASVCVHFIYLFYGKCMYTFVYIDKGIYHII